MKNKTKKLAVFAVSALLITPTLAVAPIDFDGVTGGVTDQIQEGITSGVPIFALMLALGLGIRALRKIAK